MTIEDEIRKNTMALSDIRELLEKFTEKVREQPPVSTLNQRRAAGNKGGVLQPVTADMLNSLQIIDDAGLLSTEQFRVAKEKSSEVWQATGLNLVAAARFLEILRGRGLVNNPQANGSDDLEKQTWCVGGLGADVLAGRVTAVRPVSHATIDGMKGGPWPKEEKAEKAEEEEPPEKLIRVSGPTFWDTLEEFRMAAGLTKTKLALIIGVSPGSIVNWGSRGTTPYRGTVVKIRKAARELGFDFRWPPSPSSGHDVCDGQAIQVQEGSDPGGGTLAVSGPPVRDHDLEGSADVQEALEARTPGAPQRDGDGDSGE